MSIYFIKGKGWRYDFSHKAIRYTEAWFQTKKAAKEAAAEKRKELEHPETQTQVQMTPIDMDFLTLVNRRLDHVKAYNSANHYRDIRYHSRRWTKKWRGLKCSDIQTDMIEKHVMERSKVSNFVANKELQYLRALFNYGVKRKLIDCNPTEGIEFFPVEKRKKYVPSKDDAFKVIATADPDTQQYLWTILLTAGRVGEINGLVWDDIDFSNRVVTLWTRKRHRGNREPRYVPMVQMLHDILRYRYEMRNPDLPWVFWHSYWSQKVGGHVRGPYGDRKKIMRTLCKEAKVKYFRYHALRHLTASILDNLGVPIGVIQRILGHQNRRTTEIYLHSIGESEREAMLKLEESGFSGANFQLDRHTPINKHAAYWARKTKRPPIKQLKGEIERMGYVATGKKYGVSDNAVRKWLNVNAG